MKKFFYLCLLLACCAGCVACSEKSSHQEGKTKEVTRTFDQFGFSVTTPCALEGDGTSVVEMEKYTLYEYKGVENPEDDKKAVIYYIGVRTPKDVESLEGLSEAEQSKIMDEVKELAFISDTTKIEKVSFSDRQYPGYAGSGERGTVREHCVLFNNGKYLISLAVFASTTSVAQDVLDEKFNQFASSFKAID